MIVTNDFPESRNALNTDFYMGFSEALAITNEDPIVGAIVITSCGNSSCAGGDLYQLKQFALMLEQEQRNSIRRLHAMIKAMVEGPKPIITAVEGGAAGTNVPLAAACDLIVMADDTYFSVAYVKIGLSPGGRWSLISPPVEGKLSPSDAVEVGVLVLMNAHSSMRTGSRLPVENVPSVVFTASPST